MIVHLFSLLDTIQSTIGKTVEYWQQYGFVELLFAIYRKVYRKILSKYPRLYSIRHSLLRFLFADRFTDANPMKVVWVNPSNINKIVDRESCPSKLGRVQGGDWDQNCEEFRKTQFFQSIECRIQNEKPWPMTPLYQGLMDPPEDVIWNRKCESIADRESRMEEIDRLINNLKQNGYLTQQELMNQNSDDTQKMNNDGVHPLFNEIRIVLGRNGEFIVRRRGLHRLAIAKVLGLDEVAVQIAIRHSNWQKKRNQIRMIGSDAVDRDLRDHPDLNDLLTND